MIYESDLIEKMNEADVRANILDPIINRLGYDFGAEFYVERERPLRYPYTQVGHKSAKDLPAGACDYICGIDGRRGAFALEAKRGSHALSLGDLEQAHSYAAHPAIRAEFFVISNGHEVRIYKTLGGPEDEAIVSIQNCDLENKFYQIQAILAPDALMKYAAVEYDIGEPLAKGLGSQHQIVRGFIQLNGYEFELGGDPSDPIRMAMESNGLLSNVHAELDQQLGIKQPIESGTVTRNKEGRIYADLEFGSHRPDLEHNMSAMDIHKLCFFTDQQTISTSSENPSIFETLTHKNVPQGTMLYPGLRRKLEPMGLGVDLEILIRGYGSISEGKFLGVFESATIYRLKHPTAELPDMLLHSVGEFDMTLHQ